jgi:hypothetical protein
MTALSITKNNAVLMEAVDEVAAASRTLHDAMRDAESNLTPERVSRLDREIAVAKHVVAKSDNRAVEREINNALRPATSAEIKRQIQVLIGSFPNVSEKRDLTIYAVALVDDVTAERPSFRALEAACRRVRRTLTFLPAIAEMLDALQKETSAETQAVSDVREILSRIEQGSKVLLDGRARLAEQRERRVRMCVNRLHGGMDSHWFEDEILTEARRRLSALRN